MRVQSTLQYVSLKEQLITLFKDEQFHVFSIQRTK